MFGATDLTLRQINNNNIFNDMAKIKKNMKDIF